MSNVPNTGSLSVVTIVGNGDSNNVNTGVNAINIGFKSIDGFEFDSFGNIFISRSLDNLIQRIQYGTNVITTIGGTANVATSTGDNAAVSLATFNTPIDIKFDSKGNLYVACTYDIRKITADGNGNITPSCIITTVAGTGTSGTYTGTGTAAGTPINGVKSIAFDSSGNLYFSQSVGGYVSKITINGSGNINGSCTISTVVGTGVSGFTIVGLARNAKLTMPNGIMIDSSNNLYICVTGNNCVCKVTPQNGILSGSCNLSYFAGAPSNIGYSGDGGDAQYAQLIGPVQITMDNNGNFYISDASYGFSSPVTVSIRKVVASTGIITTLIGGGRPFKSIDGSVTQFTMIGYPGKLRVSLDNDFYFVQSYLNSSYICMINTGVYLKTPSVQTSLLIAGSALISQNMSINGNTTQYGNLNVSGNITGTAPVSFSDSLDVYGNVGINMQHSEQYDTVVGGTAAFVSSTTFFQDTAIAGVLTDGVVPFAGRGDRGPFTAGIGLNAILDWPNGMAIGKDGIIYVVNNTAQKPVADQTPLICKITPEGVVSVLAGSLGRGYADGQGYAATFTAPFAMTLGNDGCLYVGDNNKIRKVTSDGLVTTIYTNANGIGGIYMDLNGNIYFSETFSGFSVKKLSPSGILTVIAGSGTAALTDGQGTAASFLGPRGITMDSSGNLYVGDLYAVRKILPDGTVTTLAGSATVGFLDGPGSLAGFNVVCGVIYDLQGNLYVCDSNNQAIKKIDISTGLVTSLFSKNSILDRPVDLKMDSLGNIYFTDAVRGRVYKVAYNPNLNATTTIQGIPGNTMSLFAGSPTKDIGSADGQGTAASFTYPLSVYYAPDGYIYVAGYNDYKIRKISLSGVVTTVAGTGAYSPIVNGPAATATFNCPEDMVMDVYGNLYVCDTGNQLIRKIDTSGNVSTLAGASSGTNIVSGAADGSGNAASFNGPAGITIGLDGNLYVADQSNWSIRKVTPQGYVTTFIDGLTRYASAIKLGPDGLFYVTTFCAVVTITPSGVINRILGETIKGGDADGIGIYARFKNIHGLAFDALGNLYIGEYDGKRIRKVTPDLVVTTLIPNDGRLYQAFNMTVDNLGNLYIANSGNNQIMKVSSKNVYDSSVAVQNLKASTITTQDLTVRGKTTLSANSEYPGVSGTYNTFYTPLGVAYDPSGNLYICDRYYYVIYKMTPQKIVSIVAGAYGSPGYTDGIGIKAQMNPNWHMIYDSFTKTMFIAAETRICSLNLETNSHITIAGSSSSGSVDGRGAAALFTQATGICSDGSGNYYITDSGANLIRKMTVTLPLTANSGVVTTFAGTGERGFYNVNLPNRLFNLKFNQPRGIAINSTKDTLFVADSGNNMIRQIAINGQYNVIISGQGGLTDSSGNQIGSPAGSVDSNNTGNVRYNSPGQVIIDANDNLIVTEETGNRLRFINTNVGCTATTLAGNGSSKLNTPGYGTNSAIFQPLGCALHPNGRTITVSCYGSGAGAAIMNYDIQSGYMSLYSQYIFAGAPMILQVKSERNKVIPTLTMPPAIATGAIFGTGYTTFNQGVTYNYPYSIVFDSDNNMYVGDVSQIRKVTPSGYTTTVFGSPTNQRNNIPGIGSQGQLTGTPYQMCLDGSGNMYVATGPANVIFKINLLKGYGQELGIRGSVPVSSPFGILYKNNSLYVMCGETGSYLVSINLTSNIATIIAGSRTISGSVNGNGTAALFSYTLGICFDETKEFIYVCEVGPNGGLNGALATGTIRKISINSPYTVTTVVRMIKQPYFITCDSNGYIYVSSHEGASYTNIGNVVRKYNATGLEFTRYYSNWTGFEYAYTDGPFSVGGYGSRYSDIYGLAVDSYNMIYLADGGKQCIFNIGTYGGDGSIYSGTHSVSGNKNSTAASSISILAPYVGVGTNNPQAALQVIGKQTLFPGNYQQTVYPDVYFSVLSDMGYQEKIRVMMEIGSATTGVGNYGCTYKYLMGFSNNPLTNGGELIFQAINISDSAGYNVSQDPKTIMTVNKNGLTVNSGGINVGGSTEIGGQYAYSLSESFVTTFAGNGRVGINDGMALDANISETDFMAMDGVGDMIIYSKLDGGTGRLRKVDRYGNVKSLKDVISNGYCQGMYIDRSSFQVVNRSSDLRYYGNLYYVARLQSGQQSIFMYNDLYGLYQTPAAKMTPIKIIDTISAYGICAHGDYIYYYDTYCIYRIYVRDILVSNIAIAPNNFSTYVTVIAGTGVYGHNGDNLIGTNAMFGGVTGMCFDNTKSNIYMTDNSFNCIFKLSLSAPFAVTVYAGTPGTSGSADGYRLNASFLSPYGITCDANNNLYISEALNHTIRFINYATGMVTRIAGKTGILGYDEFGETGSLMNHPMSICVSPYDQYIYFLDTVNCRLRKISPYNPTQSRTYGQIAINISGSRYDFDANSRFVFDVAGHTRVSGDSQVEGNIISQQLYVRPYESFNDLYTGSNYNGRVWSKNGVSITNSNITGQYIGTNQLGGIHYRAGAYYTITHPIGNTAAYIIADYGTLGDAWNMTVNAYIHDGKWRRANAGFWSSRLQFFTDSFYFMRASPTSDASGNMVWQTVMNTVGIANNKTQLTIDGTIGLTADGINWNIVDQNISRVLYYPWNSASPGTTSNLFDGGTWFNNPKKTQFRWTASDTSNTIELMYLTDSGLRVTGSIQGASKNFKIDHPVLENYKLVHASIEGPRYDLIYRNRKQLINGAVQVDLEKESTSNGSTLSPGTFNALCTNAQVFLQNNDSFDRVKGYVSSHMLFIQCENTNSIDFIDWMVTAERHDPHIVDECNDTDKNGFLILEHYVSTVVNPAPIPPTIR